MLNVYEPTVEQTNKNNQSFLCADDFITRLSALDEAVNQNLGFFPKRSIPVTHDLRTSHIFDTAESRPISQKEKLRARTMESRLEQEKRPIDCQNSRPISQDLDCNEFVLRMHSNSMPYALEEQNPDYISREKHKRKRIRSLQFGPNSSRKKNNRVSIVNEGDWREQEKLLNVELHEVDAECDAIAVGLPNLRSLSVIPTEPRHIRARHYFTKLKNGLNEWAETELNRLQQAELNQDTDTIHEVSQFLNRVQQRLHTISQLEEEYNQYWRAYKKIHIENSQQGLLSSRRESNLALAREFSKSALALTTMTSTARDTEICESARTSLESRNSVSLTKSPWYSSMMNVLRTKSKKKLYSPTDSINVSPLSDERFSWNKSLSGELCGPEFRQKIVTPPKRRRSRVTTRNLKQSRDSLTLVTQKQEEYLKQQLCHIEAQTEYLSGTIKCEVVGISGPNHYLNKDEFKVSLKQGAPVLHSLYELDGTLVSLIPLHRSTFTLTPSGTVEQKWNLHGRVQSGSSRGHRRKGCFPFDLGAVGRYAFPKQIWDHPGFVFSPALDGIFTLKVTELKRFGKDETLLHQAFDFTGLFTSKSYHLSTPLRNHGQVRFNLLIRWCPLADTDDERLLYYTSPSLQPFNSSSKRKQKANGIRFLLNDIDKSLSSSKIDSFSGLESDATRSGTSARNSQATDLTRSRSTPSPNNGSRRTSLSVHRSEGNPLERSIRRHSKITIVHADQQQVNDAPMVKATALKNWMSMPNLEQNALQKSSACTLDFDLQPTMETKIDLKRLSALSSSSSDLDRLNQPSQSISVKGSSWSDRHAPLSRKSNHLIDCGLANKLNILLDKLSQTKDIPCSLFEVIQQLEKILTELKDRLGRNQSTLSVVLPLPERNGHMESRGRMKKNLRKQDTLSALWESFAFLQEPFDGAEPSKKSNGFTSATARPASDCSDILEDPVRHLSTGWKQLDLALAWHLDYIKRLMDKLIQRKIPVRTLEISKASDLKEPSLLPPGNKNPIDLISTPMYAYCITLSLIQQIDCLQRITQLAHDFANRPQTTPLEYVASIVGGNDCLHAHACRQFIYPLVWGSCLEESNTDLTDDVDGPLLMLDVRSFQKILCGHYDQTVSPNWPEVKASVVIETFLADLLDVAINGENIFTVPLTHLEQRLRLSEPNCWRSHSVRLLDERFNLEPSPQLDDRLHEVLLYLAGQCYIQEKLQDPTASNMLSTLPYFKRSYQALFDLSTQHRALNDQTATPELTSARLVANHSTRTWLAVASLVSSPNKEIAYKAISLLMKADHDLLELSASLHFGRNSTQQSDTVFSRLSGQLPILCANGPPVHSHMCLVDLFSHSTKSIEWLPPLWASMVWGIEDSTRFPRHRMAGLQGLAVLFEQQHYQLQMKAKQLCQLGTKSAMVMNEVVSVNAISKLMAHLAAFDEDSQIRRFAKRVVQKSEMRTRVKVASPKTISGNRPITVIWNPTRFADNR